MGVGVSALSYPQAHLTNRMKPMNAQPMASTPEAIMIKSKRMPAPAVNPTKANLPTTAKHKAPHSQAHQGKSDGSTNIAAKYMFRVGLRQNDRHDPHNLHQNDGHVRLKTLDSR